jgi:hypothetical protein
VRHQFQNLVRRNQGFESRPDISKREIRSEALHYVGDAKIGKVTGNGGAYPQLRLPKTHADSIGKKAHLFKITKEGQTAFLISTSDGLNLSTEGLNQSEDAKLPKRENPHGTIRLSRLCRGGVAWLSYGPVEATTRVRISPSAFCLLISLC